MLLIFCPQKDEDIFHRPVDCFGHSVQILRLPLRSVPIRRFRSDNERVSENRQGCHPSRVSSQGWLLFGLEPVIVPDYCQCNSRG